MSTEQSRQADQALWNMVVADLIDQRQDEIVKRAWDLMKDYQPAGKRPGLERHQFTNLETLAGETRSIEVIKDFVRYQMGRDARKNTWRLPIKGGAFGDRVIQDIDGMERTAESIVGSAKKMGVQADAENQEKVNIWWLLVRRYFSYLEHAFLHEKALEKGA